MSYDIKYRPVNYADVLGQEAIIAILQGYVGQGRGYRQSYLFCGGHGSGKTTLGRILARALLCKNPSEGNPCNECFSCKSMLETGGSADFVEVDAATNSGKADVIKLTEEIQYSTFSGRQRIYLFDESHQLSKDALDALLKPLEDNIPGSEDKRLVCIFCTTEPEKMRATVLSRCAPAFVIQPQTPDHIAGRLAQICAKEKVEFEPEMLTLIAEITECHIRDALKAVEGVSMLGAVSKENVTAYLRLDLNDAYIDLLDAIGTDLPAAFEAAKRIMERASPLTCYEKLAEVSMLAFRAWLGESAPSHWGRDRLVALGATKGQSLLGYASRFASRPGHPTAAMLQMDIAHLSYVGGSVIDPAAVLQVQPTQQVVTPAPPVVGVITPPPQSVAPAPVLTTSRTPVTDPVLSGTVAERDKLWFDAEHGPAATKKPESAQKSRSSTSTALKPTQFAEFLRRTLLDLESSSGGSAG